MPAAWKSCAGAWRSANRHSECASQLARPGGFLHGLRGARQECCVGSNAGWGPSVRQEVMYDSEWVHAHVLLHRGSTIAALLCAGGPRCRRWRHWGPRPRPRPGMKPRSNESSGLAPTYGLQCLHQDVKCWLVRACLYGSCSRAFSETRTLHGSPRRVMRSASLPPCMTETNSLRT